MTQDSHQIEIFTGMPGYTKPLLRRIEANTSPIKQLINGKRVAWFHKHTDNLIHEFISQRAAKKLHLLNLIRYEDRHLKIELSNPAVLKETRLLPAKFNTQAIFVVFGDTVTLTSLDKKSPLGIIITNRAIAQTHHSIFDALWSISTPV